MEKDGLHKEMYRLESEYNQTIGFWVSFFAERAYNIDKKENGSAVKINMFKKKDSDALSLVGIGNFVKAIANAEHGADGELELKVFTTDWGESSTNDWGIMQINETFFPSESKTGWLLKGLHFTEVDWKNNPFVNIGAGIGELFTYIRYSGHNFSEQLSFDDWLDSAGFYNTGLSPKAKDEMQERINSGKPKKGDSQKRIDAWYSYRAKVRTGWGKFFNNNK